MKGKQMVIQRKVGCVTKNFDLTGDEMADVMLTLIKSPDRLHEIHITAAKKVSETSRMEQEILHLIEERGESLNPREAIDRIMAVRRMRRDAKMLQCMVDLLKERNKRYKLLLK